MKRRSKQDPTFSAGAATTKANDREHGDGASVVPTISRLIIFHTDFFKANRTSNTSINTQIVERQLVDANLVRQLTGNLALAFLNVEGESADDVLVMSPLYPNNLEQQLEG